MPSSSNPTDPQTLAFKTRILTHMNADHADSLALFARHYCRLPTSQASTARLTDVELSHLVLSTSTSFENYNTNRTTARNYIPLTPPMSSFADARTRLASMHNDALAALDLSDIPVTHYQPPQSPLHIAVFALTLWAWASLCYRPNLLPTAPVYPIYAIVSMGGRWPRFASFVYYFQPLTITLMLVIHISEAAYLVRTRLRKHQVPIGSWVWWSWVASCLNEGVAAFQRFDAIVREKEDKKKRKKH